MIGSRAISKFRIGSRIGSDFLLLPLFLIKSFFNAFCTINYVHYVQMYNFFCKDGVQLTLVSTGKFMYIIVKLVLILVFKGGKFENRIGGSDRQSLKFFGSMIGSRPILRKGSRIGSDGKNRGYFNSLLDTLCYSEARPAVIMLIWSGTLSTVLVHSRRINCYSP